MGYNGSDLHGSRAFRLMEQIYYLSGGDVHSAKEHLDRASNQTAFGAGYQFDIEQELKDRKYEIFEHGWAEVYDHGCRGPLCEVAHKLDTGDTKQIFTEEETWWKFVYSFRLYYIADTRLKRHSRYDKATPILAD